MVAAMLKPVFFNLLLVLALCSSTASATPYSNYALSGTEYFSLFNYTESSNLPRMQTFEKELTDHADHIVSYLGAHPDYENLRSRHETPIHDLGLILVYTGMFTLNINNGILEGKFDSHTFDGLGERYNKAQAYLNLALKLVPEDDRIHSWAIANELRKERAATGKVSEEVLGEVMSLVKKNPIFHLFNALTMASDFDFGPAREAELLQYTELMNGSSSPCWPPVFRHGEAKQCKTSNRTPFAFQGVTTYMGDEFLKTAAKLSETDPTNAKAYAKKALSDYKRLDFFLFKKKTKKWAQKEKLEERIRIAQRFTDTGYFDQTYLKTRNFLDIYTCTSCHQDGVAKTKLWVNLE